MLTTVLDLVGSLLVICAVAIAIGMLIALWAGVGAAGVGVLILSWIIDRKSGSRRRVR